MRRIRVTLLFGMLTACTAARATSADRVPRFDTLKDAPPSTLTELDLDRFVGRWYVVVSNFEYWTKKRRSDASFVYERIADPNVVKLADRVDYRQRGHKKAFVGVDLQDPSRAGHFHWQGDGALYGVKNQWFVAAVSPDYDWAVIYFSKSNFGTGAGLEIISRTPGLTVEQRAKAMAIIGGDPFLLERSDGLFDIPHRSGHAPGS